MRHFQDRRTVSAAGRLEVGHKGLYQVHELEQGGQHEGKDTDYTIIPKEGVLKYASGTGALFLISSFLMVAFPTFIVHTLRTGMVPYDSDSSNKKFINECSGETKKADSFADDNSTGTLLEFNSLLALKSILENFGGFSGLKCNTDCSARDWE